MSRKQQIVPGAAVGSYKTLDGSQIRELIHPDHHAVRNQSLAEAQLSVDGVTTLHRHLCSEEIYHVTRGLGEVEIGGERWPMTAGDSCVIPPGTPHRIFNRGREPLRLLCCCSPPYSHADTELLEEEG